jgi:putative FmdB family regulatory protein
VPLYEYECPQCGRFERIQKFSDPALEACPKCGSGVQKLLSAPAIQFKGSGWYITDYARKGSSEGAGGKSEGGAKASSGSADSSSSNPTSSSPSKDGAKSSSSSSDNSK